MAKLVPNLASIILIIFYLRTELTFVFSFGQFLLLVSNRGPPHEVVLLLKSFKKERKKSEDQ